MDTVAVVLATGFEETEALVPVDILRRAGVGVQVLGLSPLVQGGHGIWVQADTVLEPKHIQAYPAVVLPGGLGGAQRLAQSSLVLELVRTTQKASGWVAAMCAAPALVLGSQGFLQGVRYTGYPNPAFDYTRGFYQADASVILHAGFLTAKSMAYSLDFALCLVALLQGAQASFKVAQDVGYASWATRYQAIFSPDLNLKTGALTKQ